VAEPRFYILVGLAQSEYLQAWHQEVVLSVVAVLALLALSSGSLWLAASAWRRQRITQDFIERQEAKFRLIAENALDVIWTADPMGRLTYISPSIRVQRGFAPDELVGSTFYDPELQGQGADPLRGLLDRVHASPAGIHRFESEQFELDLPKKGGQLIRAEVRVRALWGENGHFLGFHGVTRDITERARLAAERDQLIAQLTQAISEIKSLSGMLPICAKCKKVRDDRGYWNSIESYLSDHTEATFTHGVCPDCAQELRQEMQERRASKKDEAGA
jgi:PAS domain S-box-containing protein